MPTLDHLPAIVHGFDGSHEKPSVPNQIHGSFKISLSNEVDPWSELMVLSLNGGGLKALAELHVVRMLMCEVEEYEKQSSASCSWDSPLMLPLRTENGKGLYLPCHYFDYVGGANVGGLVAILLGRLRMSVEEAIQAVEEMASVGAKPKRRKSLRSGFRVRKQPADTEKLMRSLAPYLSEREIIPGLRLLQSKFSVPDEYMCKCVTFKYATGAYEFQKSYGASTSESLEIEEAARETLSNAAPRKASGAPPKSRSNSTRTLSITTERVLVLYQEINKNLRQQTTFTESQVGDRSLQGTHQTSNAPGFLLVSIGPDDVSIGPDDVSIMADDSVGVAGGFNHTRIPEPPELARFIPNEWKLGCSHRKLQEIKEQAISHCESKPIKERLRDCARNLVYTRQQRAQTRRWERFAFGTHYNCQFCDNAGTKPEYIGDQYGLIEHLQRVHDAPPPDVSYYDDYMEILKNFRTRA